MVGVKYRLHNEALVLHVTSSYIMMCQRVSFRVGVGALYNRTHNNWVT